MVAGEALTVKVPDPLIVELAAPVTLARSWLKLATSRVVSAPRLTAEAEAKAASVFTRSVPPVRLTAPVRESGTLSSSKPPPVFSKLPAPLMSPCWKAMFPLSATAVGALSVRVVAPSMEAMVPRRPAKPWTVLSKTRMPTRRSAVEARVTTAPPAVDVPVRMSQSP